MAKFPHSSMMSLVGKAPRLDLGGSYGPNLKLADLLDSAALSELGQMPLGYRTAEGDRTLREAIADLNGVDPDDVVVTVGGMQALFLLAFILCDRGDVAVTTAPIFPPARNVLDAVGAEVRILPLSFDRGYRFDLDAFADLLCDKTKLVSLASPQNPSGVAIPHDTLGKVAALMRTKCPDAWLLIDDTYRQAAFGDDPVAPSALDLGAKVVCVASLSKAHGAPGLRLGWAITRDRALREQLVRGKFNTVVSCSAIDEALALKVFERREATMGERNRFLAECLAVTETWLRANREFVDWVRPDAGAICCVRLKAAVFDAIAVERFYAGLTQAQVRVSPGAWFGEEPRVFRLGFAHMPVPDLNAALAALTEVMRRVAVQHA